MKTLKRVALVAALALFFSLKAGAFVVTNAQVSDDSGHPIQLNAVNWFGADNAGHVVSGLWTRNWQDMIAQMKSDGINAVRLPLCPATIHGAAPSNVSYSLNPDLQGLDSRQVLDKIVAGLDAASIYILFDFHDTTCSNTLDPLWYTSSYSESQWISDMTFVAQRYARTPHALGWDIKNEPHGTATWGTGNTSTDWNKAAERAASALLQASPEWLVFVEGIQDNPNDLCQNDPSTIQHFWGENLEPFRCYPLNIPKNKLVLAPHVYGPHTYPQAYFSAANFPNNMAAIYNTVFGYLHDAGYAVVPTEWGGQYQEGYPSEDVFENNWVQYLISKGMKSAFYWAFNGNGWPRGGLLETDWSTINPAKEALLQTLWGATASAPAAAGPIPTLTLNAPATNVAAGGTLMLIWWSSNVTSCSSGGNGWAGGARSTSGSMSTPAPTVTGTYTATLTCTGAYGATSASVVYTVSPPPTVNLNVTPSSLAVGSTVQTVWWSSNVTSCSGSGNGWANGAKSTSGSVSGPAPTVAGTYTVTLTCTGPAGATTASAHYTTH